jgi:hypothetical protein
MVRLDIRIDTGEASCMLRTFGCNEILDLILRLHNIVDLISGLY